MESQIKSKALLEILKGCDVIIASKDKAVAEKVGKEIGKSLHKMGIKPKEAEALFDIAREKISDDDSDSADEIYLVAYTEDSGEDE